MGDKRGVRANHEIQRVIQSIYKEKSIEIEKSVSVQSCDTAQHPKERVLAHRAQKEKLIEHGLDIRQRFLRWCSDLKTNEIVKFFYKFEQNKPRRVLV